MIVPFGSASLCRGLLASVDVLIAFASEVPGAWSNTVDAILMLEEGVG